MSRRLATFAAAAIIALAPCFTSTAAAQDAARSVAPSPSFLSSFGPSINLADLEVPTVDLPAPDAAIAASIAAEQTGVPQNPFRPRSDGPSGVMASLYVSTAVMQALDAHSTLVGLERGAYEANPLMSGITRNKFAFIGIKAAVAAGTIYAAREMAKRNKVAAVITLVAINSAYAYVAHHNYSVANRLR